MLGKGIGIGVVLGLVMVTVPVSSTGAASTDVVGPLGTASVSIPNRSFEASGCVYVPVEVKVETSRPWIRWEVELVTRFPGSSNSTTNWIYGEGTGSKSDEIGVCRFAGSWRVTGTVKMRDDDAEPPQKFESAVATSFVVSKAKTTLTLTSIKQARFYREISGRLTIRSVDLGVVGLDGLVVVEMRKGKRWVQVGVDSADSRGRYTIATYEEFSRGTVFRAVHDATSTTLKSVSKTFRY